MAGKNRIGSVMAVMAAPALLATIAASYTAFWFYNVSSMKKSLDKFAAVQRQAGHTAKYTIDGTDGFPWTMKVILKNVDFSYGNERSTWRISGPELVLVSGVFSPRQISAELPNNTRLSQTKGNDVNAITKTDGNAELTVMTDSESAVREVVINLENFQATGSWNGRDMATPLKVGNGTADLTIASAHQRDKEGDKEGEEGPFAALSIDLKKWQWPNNARYTLGSNLDSLDLSAKMYGVIDPKIDLKQALTMWRDDGGKISVGRIAMKWGVSSLGGYGTVVLDDNLQPAASVTTQVKGFTNIVNLLDQIHLIRPQDATLARVVIGQQLPKNGTGNLSLSLRNGTVFVGPLELTKVPLIEWPADPKDKNDGLLKPGFDIGPDGKITRKGQ